MPTALPERERRILAHLRSPLTLASLEGVRAALSAGGAVAESAASIGRALRSLRARGLVESETEGPRRWWSSTPEGCHALEAYEAEQAQAVGLSGPVQLRIRADGSWAIVGHDADRTRFASPLAAAAHLRLRETCQGLPAGRTAGLRQALAAGRGRTETPR